MAKTGGRAKGTPNKLSATAKENIVAVFNRLDGTAGMARWAEANQTPFYQIYSKLLPSEVEQKTELTGTVEIATRPQLSKEEWLAVHGVGTTGGTTE